MPDIINYFVKKAPPPAPPHQVRAVQLSGPGDIWDRATLRNKIRCNIPEGGEDVEGNIPTEREMAQIIKKIAAAPYTAEQKAQAIWEANEAADMAPDSVTAYQAEVMRRLVEGERKDHEK